MTDKQIDTNEHQQLTCGHTQYGGYSVIQRLWLVSTFLHLDSDVASKSRTAHTAVRQHSVEKTLQQYETVTKTDK